LTVRLFTAGFGFAPIFFASVCVLVRTLIPRHRVAPAAIGV